MSNEEEKSQSRVTVRFPKQDYRFLGRLVEQGEYINIADAVRDAIKRLRVDWETRQSYRSEEKESALLAYREDFKNIGIKDWVVAHTSFMLPFHQYKGEIIRYSDSIFFRGKDKDTKEPHVLAFPLRNIVELHYGFDDTYRRIDDRSLGLFTEPLRMTFREGNSQKTIYLWIGFNRLTRTSTNRKWFENLSALRGER